jgi:hypothetical protein
MCIITLSPWKPRCFSAEMGFRHYRTHDLAAAEQLPLACPCASLTPLPCHTFPSHPFLTCAASLSATSLISNGFYKCHRSRKTQSSMEQKVQSLVFVLVFLILQGLCQLGIRSVRMEQPLLNLFDCYNNCFLIVYKLPCFWVRR